MIISLARKSIDLVNNNVLDESVLLSTVIE